MKTDIADQDIAGARVRRAFTYRGEDFKPGRRLSADEVLALPVTNRRALIAGGFLKLFPRRGAAMSYTQTVVEWFRELEGWRRERCASCGGYGVVSAYGWERRFSRARGMPKLRWGLGVAHTARALWFVARWAVLLTRGRT
jgi:hypothetical protein